MEKLKNLYIQLPCEEQRYLASIKGHYTAVIKPVLQSWLYQEIIEWPHTILGLDLHMSKMRKYKVISLWIIVRDT